MATERIDVLQGMLKFLARDTAELVLSTAASTPKANEERQLVERKEQLALLMDEGQRLSKTELANQTLIKKLRAKLGQEKKRLADALRRADQAHTSAAESQEKLQRAKAAEKQITEKIQQLSVRSSEENHRLHTVALEAERKLVIALREELSRARMDKQASDERARTEMRELKERAERERARPSGGGGAALQTMETLQTQYALSSENCPRIEEFLMAHMANAKEERNDVA
ncbi:MAG: hypothetical protein M1826_001308 [Phylliscum demangeonii]|nr:MAG: hypothetical protein M1826_001308 [Phylliscum demangeonii]